MYTTQNDDTKNEQQNSKFSDIFNAQNSHSGAQTCTMWLSATNKPKSMCILRLNVLQNHHVLSNDFVRNSQEKYNFYDNLRETATQ
jgi:hypothetical protein